MTTHLNRAAKSTPCLSGFRRATGNSADINGVEAVLVSLVATYAAWPMEGTPSLRHNQETA